MIVRSGVTRLVIVTRRYVVKMPRFRSYAVRGWLANRSEWQQRRRAGVAAPLVTVAHLLTLYRRADEVGNWDPELAPGFARVFRVDDDGTQQLNYEESKGSSWGRFGDRWLLIDYDRAWEEPRGLVGKIYYGRQERAARRWMRAATSDVVVIDGAVSD